MQALYERLESDRGFFNSTFWRYKFHDKPDDPCSDECYQMEMCSIRTGRSHDPSICPNLNMHRQEQYHLKHKMC